MIRISFLFFVVATIISSCKNSNNSVSCKNEVKVVKSTSFKQPYSYQKFNKKKVEKIHAQRKEKTSEIGTEEPQKEEFFACTNEEIIVSKNPVQQRIKNYSKTLISAVQEEIHPKIIEKNSPFAFTFTIPELLAIIFSALTRSFPVPSIFIAVVLFTIVGAIFSIISLSNMKGKGKSSFRLRFLAELSIFFNFGLPASAILGYGFIYSILDYIILGGVLFLAYALFINWYFSKEK